MTQQLAAAFEKRISEHPQDWHMLQRVFISDLDRARLPGPQSGPAGPVRGSAGPGTAVPDTAGPGSMGPEAGG
jgi:hypothetical protein